jgi:tetratricopeptide (TPR) repeat protein
MVLDACRTNPFPQATFGMNGIALLEAGLGAYIVFAASPGQTATENAKDRNGFFTGYLLQALRQPLNISDLFRRVRKEVYDASGHNQLPYIHDQAIAEFALRAPAPSSAAGVAPTAAEAPPMVDALFEEGKNFYHAGRCKEALSRLDQVVRRNPTNAYVQNAIGLAYVCLSMTSPAVEHFSRAIELKPAYAAAYWNRGQVFVRSAQYELAIEDFDWALEQEPDNASLYWRRGVAKLGLRRYEAAQKDFTMAIARDSSSPYGYHGRGRVFYELGKYREALGDFDAAVARKHDFADAIDYRNRVIERLNAAR